MLSNQEILEKAKGYAFLLLKFRLRSEKELYSRLKKKKFTSQVITETLSFLKEKNFINDSSFAHAWIESRLKRPLGLNRIRQELKIKGIDKEIIESEIRQVKEDYSEEEIVKEIAQEKFNKLKGIEPEKAKRRVFSYLLRRGFSSDTVNDVVRELCKQTP